METPVVYVPMDRRHALARGAALPNRTTGAALFADISGFTPLTEALLRELGPQRGAEELTRYLNLVYDAVIEEVHRFGGSVIAFAGDAITCWFDGDAGRRAVACALAMQAAMAQFSAVSTPGGASVALAMKTAIAAGPVRRFLVGDPALRVLDALAGATLARLATAEHLAQRGETVVDGDLLPQLAGIATTGDLRIDGATGQHVCVVTGLEQSVPPAPWAPLAGGALKDEEVRPWLLPQVYARLRQGMGDFLAELRSTVALFVRFGGIDYGAGGGSPLRRHLCRPQYWRQGQLSLHQLWRPAGPRRQRGAGRRRCAGHTHPTRRPGLYRRGADRHQPGAHARRRLRRRQPSHLRRPRR
jgi:class 3 adenylate cyclase